MNRLVIEVCVGTSCYLLGAQDLLQAIEELPAEQQGKVEINGVTCLKNCGKGPNIRINGTVYSGVTPERLLQVIDENLL